MKALIVSFVVTVAVVGVAKGASVTMDSDALVVAGSGFVRSGAPLLLLGTLGMVVRRQRRWYDDPDLLNDITDLPKLPQDFTYFPRA